MGKTGPRRKTSCERGEVSPEPKDAKADVTGFGWESEGVWGEEGEEGEEGGGAGGERAWKSCPKPAMPTESSLGRGGG